MKDNVPPWTDTGDPCTYTDRELRRTAVQAARDFGGRLLDWRIILRSEHHNFFQTRVVMPDGRVLYHNTAI